jgi:large subunit ribosomal protein L18
MNKREARIRRGIKTKAIIRQSTRPRLVVFRSLTNIYAQIIVPGDKGDQVLVQASSIDNELKPTLKGTKVEQAYEVGKLLGSRAKNKLIEAVAFDRSGNKYHGRIASLAKGAREAGLDF